MSSSDRFALKPAGGPCVKLAATRSPCLVASSLVGLWQDCRLLAALLWVDEILHQVETMGNHCLPVFAEKKPPSRHMSHSPRQAAGQWALWVWVCLGGYKMVRVPKKNLCTCSFEGYIQKAELPLLVPRRIHPKRTFAPGPRKRSRFHRPGALDAPKKYAGSTAQMFSDPARQREAFFVMTAF